MDAEQLVMIEAHLPGNDSNRQRGQV